jgi:hypothetical protein
MALLLQNQVKRNLTNNLTAKEQTDTPPPFTGELRKQENHNHNWHINQEPNQ